MQTLVKGMQSGMPEHFSSTWDAECQGSILWHQVYIGWNFLCVLACMGSPWHQGGESEAMLTAGHAWETEYGDPDNKTDFEYLIKYSPLHNVRVPAGTHQFPATMLTTGALPHIPPSHSKRGKVLPAALLGKRC